MSDFVLTAENYYTREADEKYCSVSQYKDFIGMVGKRGCETMALAKMQREFETPMTVPLMVGSYVDAFFEGTLPTFAAQHPEIFSSRGASKGELKSDYKQASVMIDRATKDPLFMKYMAGDEQVIMTGEIEGVPFKIKIDSTDGRRLTDLKTVKNINESFYVKDSGERVSFIEWWSYDLQAAVYQEIYRQNTGDILPFYICAISKDKTYNIPHPRIAVIELQPLIIRDRLEEVKRNAPHIQELKDGIIEPIPGGLCDWCADNLPLTGVTSSDMLMAEY